MVEVNDKVSVSMHKPETKQAMTINDVVNANSLKVIISIEMTTTTMITTAMVDITVVTTFKFLHASQSSLVKIETQWTSCQSRLTLVT